MTSQQPVAQPQHQPSTTPCSLFFSQVRQSNQGCQWSWSASSCSPSLYNLSLPVTLPLPARITHSPTHSLPNLTGVGLCGLWFVWCCCLVALRGNFNGQRLLLVVAFDSSRGVCFCVCVWSPSSLTLLSPSLSSLHSALCGPLCRSVVFSSCGLPRAMLKLG